MHAKGPSQRVEEIFQQALDLPGGARTAYLEQACAGEESLRALVEALLHADAEADQSPVWQATALVNEAWDSAVAAPPVVDRYRLRERLGMGGMGVVYRAERSDGAYEKQIAIKIVPWAAGDEKVQERFRTERALLARLDHPNIARLLDGGTTSDGL